ncbi:hypothetical protein BDV93DRAFT_610898 [Ceratobasidium sp. AG-I]|nr:hypothetical protein BDV93DRAFT_610898 [Ceratobasidium sp. AG-I]
MFAFSVENYTIGCDSATLVTGATYQTLNGEFTYTITSLYDQTTGKRTSNASYNGTMLSNCTVDTITVTASYSTYEATFEATVNCSFPDGLEVIATTSTAVSMPIEGLREAIDGRSSNLAHDASRLISGVGSDFFYEVVFRDLLLPNRTDMTSLRFFFQIYQNFTIDELEGSRYIGVKHLDVHANLTNMEEIISPQSPIFFKNYLWILSSAILSDLGIASQPNVMASKDLFMNYIEPVSFSEIVATKMPSIPITVNGILANMSSYNLPFTSIQPTRFSAQYLCNYRDWKTPTSLVMDICVATTSLFLGFWGTLRVVLGFLARRMSAKSKALNGAQNVLQDQEKSSGEKVWLMEHESFCEDRSESGLP